MVSATSQTPTEKPKTGLKAWFRQPNNRNIIAVLGLGFFFVVVMMGVLIAQRQLLDRSATAPNAPVSEPEAFIPSCTVRFNVPAPPAGPLDFSCIKTAYQNDARNSNPDTGGRYYLLTEKSVYRPGEIVVFDVVFLNNGTYTIDLEMVDSFSDRRISTNLTFLDSECGEGAFDPRTNTLTCTIDDVAPNSGPISSAPPHRAFRMQVKDTAVSGTSITNTVRITPISFDEDPQDQLTGGATGRTAETPTRTASPESRFCQVTIRIETPPTTPTPPPTPPSYSCNSVCRTDAQCQTANPNFICYYPQSSASDDSTIISANAGRCRLKANATSAQCTPASPVPTPSPTPRVTPSPSATPRVTPSPSPSPRVTPTPTQTPNYACNATCSTDEQCRGVNAGYICHPDLKVCRLDTNRSSASCQPQQNSYACNSTCTTNAQCQTANGSYICSNGQCRLDSNPSASSCLPPNYVPPAPAIGCNDTCSSNADCSNPDHICSTTADGTNRCRLADYTNSATCSKPPQITTSAPGQQPVLPEQLPQTGAFEFGTWVKAGIAALGIGAVLLLFL